MMQGDWEIEIIICLYFFKWNPLYLLLLFKKPLN